MRTFALVFFAAFASLAVAKDAPLPADAVASVNGHAIPAQLFEGLLKNNQDALPRADLAAKERAPAVVLDELIDRSLVTQEAIARKIFPNQSELDETEKSISANFGGEKRYLDFLAQNHLTRAQYRSDVVAASLCRDRLAQALAQEHPLTDDEVAAYYQQHSGDAAFQLPERLSVAHINLRMQHDWLGARLEHENRALAGPELEQAIELEKMRRRKLADDLLQQLKGGADFAELAAKYSDDPGTRAQGGVLETFPRRAHPREFEDAAFALRKPGDLSAVIEDIYGLHLIKLLEHFPARAATLAEARGEIQARLEREREATYFNAWMREARARAVIVRRKGFAPAASTSGAMTDSANTSQVSSSLPPTKP